MTQPVVDLRSDTVTRPTPEMRRAIAEAVVGDDVFGDDPTVRQLETETARILGKQAALFVPSGTMANEVSIAAHTERGDEVIVDDQAHIFLYEGAGPAILSGVQTWPIRGDRGLVRPSDLRSAVRMIDPHFPRSRLFCVENTHNRAGGRVLPSDTIQELAALATEFGLRTHLDGARLWNAAVASGKSEAELAAPFDSVSVCFSKGLGAPVGSAIAGRREWVERARRFRKTFGGGMRQTGILAAAALHALAHHRQRLADDHARARNLAERLDPIPGLSCDVASVETNIVIVRLDRPSDVGSWVGRLSDAGVLALPFGEGEIRFVTHLDIDDSGIDHAVEAADRVSRAIAS